MKSDGLASAFGGNVAVMDIYAAQKVFGRGRTFDRIDLAVKRGVTLEECQRELGTLLGPAFEIRPPSGRSQQFEAMLAGYSMMMSISSAFALFIGMFIIYNAFSIAVTQRRSEIGILRALGATRGQIRSLFLGESAAIGVLGSVVGATIGVLAARAIATSLGGLIAGVYGVVQHSDELIADPFVVAMSIVVGVATSIVAAAIPARNAARVDPVHALQKGKWQILTPTENRLRTAVAAVLGVTALVCLAGGDSRSIFYTGYLLFIGAALLLSPLLSLGLAKMIRPVLSRLRPVEGALAVDSLIQAPRRTSATVAALMFSLALVVAFDGMAQASYRSIVAWMNTTLNPDLFVMPTQRLDIQSTRFPATMGSEIAALPGVDRVQPMRNGRVTFRGISVAVIAIDMSRVVHTDELPPIEGDAKEMYAKAAAGEGLIVSENLAQLQQLTFGEILEIPAPYGTVRLPIVGVVADYSDQQGAIIVDRRVFIDHWRDDSVNVFRVYVAGDVPAGDVRQRIMTLYEGRRQLFVLTNAELKAYIMKIAGQWFGLTNIQIAIAVVVAILGIVNTLTVSITDRRRELGVLRALGALRGQVRRTIWIEALTVGFLGIVLGAACGAINLFYVLEIVHRDVAGMQLDYRFPVATTLSLAPIILAAAFAAAVWPAESAVRGSLTEALEYE